MSFGVKSLLVIMKEVMISRVLATPDLMILLCGGDLEWFPVQCGLKNRKWLKDLFLARCVPKEDVLLTSASQNLIDTTISLWYALTHEGNRDSNYAE